VWKTGNHFSTAGQREAHWQIIAETVKNDTELEKFIKQRFGSGCSLGTKEPSNQQGVYTVRVKGGWKELDLTACPINYMYIIKYRPSGTKSLLHLIGDNHLIFLKPWIIAKYMMRIWKIVLGFYFHN